MIKTETVMQLRVDLILGDRYDAQPAFIDPVQVVFAHWEITTQMPAAPAPPAPEAKPLRLAPPPPPPPP